MTDRPGQFPLPSLRINGYLYELSDVHREAARREAEGRAMRKCWNCGTDTRAAIDACWRCGCWESRKPDAPPPTAPEESELEQAVTERDRAEEALSQAYYLVTGRTPEWSNLFGHIEALEEITDAIEVLRADAKRLREALEETRRCLLEYTEHEAGDEVSLAIARADNALAQGGNDG